MALVIVKKGKKADSQKWTGSCRNCGAKAEAIRSDMKNITSDFREGGEFSWEFCPECNTGSPALCAGLLMHPVSEANDVPTTCYML